MNINNKTLVKQKSEKILQNQKANKAASGSGAGAATHSPIVTPAKKSPIKSWRPSPHILTSPGTGVGISSALSGHTQQYDSMNYDVNTALETLKPIQETHTESHSGILTTIGFGSPSSTKDHMAHNNAATYKNLQNTQNIFMHGPEDQLAVVPGGGGSTSHPISGTHIDSIRYQAGLVTDADAQEAAYFQLPSCSTVVASSAVNAMRSNANAHSNSTALSRRKVSSAGTGTIQPTPHSTSIHGYINRPLHITTALFGYLSFNTLKNDFVLDSTTISQQLLGTAPPITHINTSMLLDSVVTATHIDNCKRFLGNYLHECIRRFDRVILHIVNKVNHLLLKNTNSTYALTNQQRQQLQDVLHLSIYEVPNSLSTSRVAATPSGVFTGNVGFGSGSVGFGFGGTASTASALGSSSTGTGQSGSTLFGNLKSNASSMFNLSPSGPTSTTAVPSVSDIYSVLTDTNKPTQMFNLQDILYKLLFPIFSMDQSTVDAVSQSNNRVNTHSSVAISGVELIEEYDALATLFLSLFNKQQRGSTFISSVKTMTADDMSRLKYVLTTPCDIYYTTATSNATAATPHTEPCRNSIGYCILYHTKELVIHDATLSKVVWPIAPPKLNEQLTSKQHISISLPSDVEILMCIFLYYCNNTISSNDSNKRVRNTTKLTSSSTDALSNNRFSDVRYFDALQSASDFHQNQHQSHLSGYGDESVVSILEVPNSNYTDITTHVSHYSDYIHDMISTGVGNNHIASSSFLGVHHAHSNASYHYIDNSALLIDTPHFNILLYDRAINECIEIVLDSNHHQNSVMNAAHSTNAHVNSANRHKNNKRELPNTLKELICKVFMIDQISEFEILLKHVNILQ